MGKECAFMLDDGGCKIGPEKTGSGNAGDVRRPEGDITITAPVGIASPNKYDDVFNIQYGLDQVAPIDGGPSPQLKIDGLCGPKTTKAIQDFQRKHFGWQGCDGKIEPGKQTIKRLNELRNRNTFPHLPLSLTVDDWLLAGMLQHLPHTRSCIEAARQYITLAQSNGITTGVDLLERHFKASTFQGSKTAVLQNLHNVYGFMLNVIDRPDEFFTLDTDDSGEGISTVAFARLGGFFNKKDTSGKIRFRRGSYFATGIQDFAAFVMIHELRHFVESGGANGHFAKGWVTDAGMAAMPGSQSVLNCDSAAGFALEARNGVMERPGWVKSSVFR